ncbi:MAG TPA: DUF2079 domain-containing protein [Acidimicrobiales bacterium]|nr:DUF2079 domain-containing protein [Acidimicrobiales bacterium]
MSSAVVTRPAGAWTRARRAATARRVLPHLPLAVMMAAYVVHFCSLSISVFDGYGDPPFDMALFDQGIWLLSRFHAPFVTVMGRDMFGDHTCFILLLVVPLYWIWPHAQLLLVLQTLLLAGAAVPVYLVARRYLRSTVLATAMAGVYLLNPALQNGNLEQFHPEAFSVMGVALAIYAALEWRPRLLVGAVIVCLMVKQDAGMLIMPLGLWVAWRRDRRWGLGIFAAAAAWQAVAFEVIVYAFLGTTSFQADRIPFGGMGGVLRTFFFHATTFWRYALGGHRPFYLWQMGVSVGWMFVLAPEVAAVAVLSFLENYLSQFPYQHQIIYHYSLPLVPVLVLGTVWAISRRRSATSRAALTFVSFGCALVACVVWGLAPFSVHKYPHWSPDSPEVHDINAVEKALPADAVVSAWYPYVAHIDHRVRVYMWPTPFYAVDWHLYEHPGARLPFADQIQYLFLPAGGGGSPQVFASIAAQFRVVEHVGDVYLYRRVPGAGPAASGSPGSGAAPAADGSPGSAAAPAAGAGG